MIRFPELANRPTRRDFLRNAGGGLGMIALASLFAEQDVLAQSRNPLAPRQPHHAARAQRLGTESQNMPAFVVLPDPQGWVKGGAPAWGNGYLPAAFQGTVLAGGRTPIRYLNPPAGIDTNQQRRTLDLVNRLNQEHLRP